MILRGRILAAVLAAVAAGAAALAAAGSPPPRGQIMRSVDSLPWAGLLLDGQPLNAKAPPAAVLYVLPTCEHCDSAAVAFAAEIRRARMSGLIISASGRERAEEYRRRFGLPQLATDSTLEFARAAGIRVAPVLGRPAGDGRIAFAPLNSPALIRYYLSAGR